MGPHPGPRGPTGPPGRVSRDSLVSTGLTGQSSRLRSDLWVVGFWAFRVIDNFPRQLMRFANWEWSRFVRDEVSKEKGIESASEGATVFLGPFSYRIREF